MYETKQMSKTNIHSVDISITTVGEYMLCVEGRCKHRCGLKDRTSRFTSQYGYHLPFPPPIKKEKNIDEMTIKEYIRHEEKHFSFGIMSVTNKEYTEYEAGKKRSGLLKQCDKVKYQRVKKNYIYDEDDDYSDIDDEEILGITHYSYYGSEDEETSSSFKETFNKFGALVLHAMYRWIPDPTLSLNFLSKTLKWSNSKKKKDPMCSLIKKLTNLHDNKVCLAAWPTLCLLFVMYVLMAMRNTTRTLTLNIYAPCDFDEASALIKEIRAQTSTITNTLTTIEEPTSYSFFISSTNQFSSVTQVVKQVAYEDDEEFDRLLACDDDNDEDDELKIRKIKLVTYVKHDIDVIETINIELEHKVAKLLKENEILKRHYKELSDSIKTTRAKTIEHTTSLIAQNVEFKAQLQEKGYAIVALKNELRKLTRNSVDTKFAKPSISGKPVLQPHRNQSVVRQPTAFKSVRPRISKPRFASQVDVNNDLSKPITTRYLPKGKESACAKANHMIASSSSRYSSNDMVHNHYLEEAKKKTQEIGRNSKPSVMPSAKS
ncbi:hypothetical protein Tco_1154210 [Tanacetum coccineum]